MYRVRLWSSRRARLLETIYIATRPLILTLLNVSDRLFGRKLDKPITAIEAQLKGFFFDCQMCGNCVLSKTGMSCPMNCPKSIRNGPCGGVRANGMCEVNPNMRCVWLEAWQGAGRMQDKDAIKGIEFAVDHRLKGSSSWLRIARDE